MSNPGRALLERYERTQPLEISVAVAQFPAIHVCNIVTAVAVAHGHTLKAMMELTMSLPFSFKALTAFFLDTEAWVMTSSMSLLSRPVSSTSSSSQELADKLAIHRNTIGAWERGDNLPSSRAVVFELAKALHLSPKETDHLLYVCFREPLQDSSGSESTSLNTHQIPWTVAYRRNLFFTGREELLAHLHQALHHKKAVTLPQSYALSGLGGIGKTQIALEYAYRYQHDCQAVLWATADTAETLMTDFVKFASALRLPHRAASRPTRPPSPRSWRGTGRWCWASAGSSWAITITPRTPSRPPSSSWRGRPGRSATPTCSAPGSTAWRSARPARPAARLARRRRTEEARRRQAGRRHVPPCQAEQVDRPRAGRGAAPRDRPPAGGLPPGRSCSATSRASRLDEAAGGCDGPAGTLRSRLVRAREKLRRGLSRRGVVLSTTAMAAALAPRSASASVSSPPVRFHHPGRDRLRGPSRRRRGALGSRRGPGPGGPEIHARPQAESRGAVPAAARHPGRGAGISMPSHNPGRASLPASPFEDGSDGASPSRCAVALPNHRARPRAG